MNQHFFTDFFIVDETELENRQSFNTEENNFIFLDAKRLILMN